MERNQDVANCSFFCFSIGYSLHIASQFDANGVFAYDRIEDAVVQADEIDGKYLQFEGGLSITGSKWVKVQFYNVFLICLFLFILLLFFSIVGERCFEVM